MLQPIQGDVAEVVERVVRAMRFRAEFGQIRFTHVREGPTEARFDPKKLERALYNLVLNACEAVPLDSGKIDICTIRAGDEIEIIIADNGPGIPEGIRDSVFQPFVSHGKENGTGLGLAVAQKVVRDHGGDISIDSVSESGTVFKVRIPMLLSAREDGPVAPHQVKHAPKS